MHPRPEDEVNTIARAGAAQVGTNRWGWAGGCLFSVLVVACGQASRSPSMDETATVSSGGSGGAQSSAAATTTSPTTGGSGGATTGGATTGGGGGAGNESECSILVDECPDGSFCFAVAQNDEGPVFRCTSECDYDEDCDAGEECYSPDSAGGPKLCSPARPECEPTAGEGECTCSTVGSAVLVRGTGDDCEVVSTDASACYWQNGTCLDACIREYYRYELDDGTALVVGALQGEMPPGWVSDGQGDAPESCPAVPAEEL